MPKFKNVSGDDQVVLDRMVLAGMVIDVSDAQADGLRANRNYSEVKPADAPADAPAEATHDEENE